MPDRDTAFSAFVAARSAALFRTAYLLTRDPIRAEGLLKTSLAKTYLAWRRIKDVGSVEAYVRRDMVRALVLPWPRWRDRDLVGVPLPIAEDDVRSAERAALWRSLDDLPVTQRTALVLAYWVDLSDPEIAHDMGTSVGAAETHAQRGLSAIGNRQDLLTETFAAAISTLEPPTQLSWNSILVARRIRTHRRLGALAGVAGCSGLVLAVAAAAPAHPPTSTASVAKVPSPAASAFAATSTAPPPPLRNGRPFRSRFALPTTQNVLAGLGALFGIGQTVYDGDSRVTLHMQLAAESQIRAIARLHDGYLVTLADGGGLVLAHVDDEGKVRILDRTPVSGVGQGGLTEVAVSKDGSQIAYARWSAHGQSFVTDVRIVDTAGHLLQHVALPGLYAPQSIDKTQVWLDGSNDPSSPPVIWNRGTGTVRAFRTVGKTTLGTTDLAHGHVALSDYTCNLIVASTSSPDRTIAKRCQDGMFSFSPDGSVLISASNNRSSGGRYLQVNVLSTKDLKVRWALPVPLAVTTFTWSPVGNFIGVDNEGGVMDADPKTGNLLVYDTPSLGGTWLALAPTS